MTTELQRLTEQIATLTERHRGVLAEMTALNDRYRSETMPVDAVRRFDDLERAAVKLADQLTPLTERRDGMILDPRASQRAAIAGRSNLTGVTGDGAAAVGAARNAHFNIGAGNFDADEMINRAASLGGSATPQGTAALVDSARAAIDNWVNIRAAVPATYQDAAERMVTGVDPRYRGDVARHVIALSTPAYDEAFAEYLTSGPQFMSSDARRTLLAGEMAANQSRAMNEGSIAAGQAIVPPFLDPTIILTNTGTINPFRQLADVRQIATQTWLGVTSQGVTAEWTAEAAEATDASPRDFAQPSITPVRADAYVQISYELAADTSIVTDLAQLFADAKDRIEGTAFAVGTGSTQPFGVVTELNLTTASRLASTTNGSFGAVDIFALDSALPARYRPNASWSAHPGIYNLIRQMGTSPSPYSSTFWVDFGGDVPSKLLGRPVYESSAMVGALSAATASNDDLMILGDFRSGMKIIDRVGMSVGQTVVIGPNRRPTGESGYFAFWRVGSAVVNPDAFRMLVC